MAAAVVATLAGCGSSSDHPEKVALAALRLPSAKQPPEEAPSPAGRCSHPTASLRPPAVIPTPGAMPAGSFMAHILHTGHLTVGVDQNTYRLAYFNPLKSELQGFEIDLARQIAKAIFGNPNAVRFIAITTGERIPDV